MSTCKHLTLASLITAGAFLAGTAAAQATDQGKMPGAAASTPAADLTDGEVKKVDKDNKKLTIKHGDIKNLDMPSMTMVFQVKDAAMVDKVKVGDKIRFKVERGASGFVVAELQPASK